MLEAQQKAEKVRGKAQQARLRFIENIKIQKMLYDENLTQGDLPRDEGLNFPRTTSLQKGYLNEIKKTYTMTGDAKTLIGEAKYWDGEDNAWKPLTDSVDDWKDKLSQYKAVFDPIKNNFGRSYSGKQLYKRLLENNNRIRCQC